MSEQRDETQGPDEVVDVVIVGGGAAGLTAALNLGRVRRSVVVVDAGEPRNAPAAHMHGYLGREGTSPLELLRIGREEVAGYGVRVLPGLAVRASGTSPTASRWSWPTAVPSTAAACWWRPAWSTSCPRSPGSGSAGAATSCTAPSATGGRSGTVRWS